MSDIVLGRRWAPPQEGRCLYWQDTQVLRGLYTDSAIPPTTPVVSSGDQVGTILDLSGNAANAIQTSASLRGTYTPTAVNSKPAITLDGTDDYYPVALSSVPANGTIFVVWKPISLVGFSSPGSIRSTPGGNGPGGVICYYNIISGRVTVSSSNAVSWTRTFAPGAGTPNGTACQWVWTWGNAMSDLDFRCNRTASSVVATAGTYTTPTATNLYLGAGYFTNKGGMALAEFIVFGEQLAAARRARIEKYLSLKWGTP